MARGDPIQHTDWMCDADHVIVAEHRRKGVYQALSDFNFQDLEGTSFRFIVDSSANATAAPSLLKMEYQSLGPVQPFVRLRPSQVAPDNKLRSVARQIPSRARPMQYFAG